MEVGFDNRRATETFRRRVPRSIQPPPHPPHPRPTRPCPNPRLSLSPESRPLTEEASRSLPIADKSSTPGAVRSASRFGGPFWPLFAGYAALFAIALWFDAAVAEFFSRPLRSGQLNSILASLRCWGEGPTLVLLALGISIAAPARTRMAVWALVCALAVGATVELIKPVFARMRPDEALALGETGSWHHQAGRNSSFPSGHTATAFSFARGLSAIVPGVRPVCLLAASGTALSRMHSERHYLSDCVAGALIGWYLTALLWRVFPSLETRLLRANPVISPRSLSRSSTG